MKDIELVPATILKTIKLRYLAHMVLISLGIIYIQYTYDVVYRTPDKMVSRHEMQKLWCMDANRPVFFEVHKYL